MGSGARIALAICLQAGALNFAACTNASSTSTIYPWAAQMQPPSNLAPSAQANPPEEFPALPPDPAGQSRVLTSYFAAHRLPLVGASVIATSSGRQVILYGFVATDHGKTDAEEDVRRIVNDSQVAIDDRIVVQPQLLTMNDPGTQPDAVVPSGDMFAKVASYQSYPATDQTGQYLAQQSHSNWTSWIIPLLMIAPLFIP
jgi:hypothetical protein